MLDFTQAYPGNRTGRAVSYESVVAVKRLAVDVGHRNGEECVEAAGPRVGGN